MEPEIRIFTDGACKGNPGPGGWGAVCVDFSDGTVTELNGFEPATTNNAMEVMAGLKAIEWVVQSKKGRRIEILSDSTYLVRGALNWIEGWKSRQWTTKEGTPVSNQVIWKALDRALAAAAASGSKIVWKNIPAHSGIPGNERADSLSALAANGERTELYRGPIRGYSFDISAVWQKSSQSPAWYVSWVDQKIVRHKTWSDCEARVKGRAGAKFKKVTSEEEEAQILRAWGALQL